MRISRSCRSIVPSAAHGCSTSSPGAVDRRPFYCLKIPNRPPGCCGGGCGGGGGCWNCGCGCGGGRWGCFGGAAFCPGGGGGFGGSGCAVTTVVSGPLQSVSQMS